MSGCKEIARFEIQHLKQGGNLVRTVDDDGCMFIVYGEGEGCTLHVLGGAVGFFVPIRGTVRVNSTNLNQTVHAKEALITEHDSGIRGIGHANSRWLAMLGAKRAWSTLLNNVAGNDIELLPEFHQVSRDLRHKAVAVARATTSLELESAVHAISSDLANGQTALRIAIARCPGRTYARRRQIFLRLQRVRNYMSAHCDEELDNEMLAKMANYSSCHFLRTFSSVFMETPHAYLVHQRLLRAKHLFQSGKMTVTEVALATGFESRSAFSRLFRQRFGTTAKETMRRSFSGAQL